MKRLISVRKSSKVFGRGTLTFVRPANRAVLAYVRQIDDEAILCVCNLSRSAQAAELDLSPWKGRIPQEMLGRVNFPRIGDLPYLVTLAALTASSGSSLHKEAEDVAQMALPREVSTLGAGRWLGQADLGLDVAHVRDRCSAGLCRRCGAGLPTRRRASSPTKVVRCDSDGTRP